MKYIILSFITISCSFDFEPEYQVDPNLIPFVDEFFHQADLHNIVIYKQNLLVKFDKSITDKGQFYKRSQNLILINQDFFYSHINLDSANTNFIKLVIFHELGHWQGRPHCSGLSIMNSGDPFEGKGDFVGTVQKFNGHPEKRKEIINELFSGIQPK